MGAEGVVRQYTPSKVQMLQKPDLPDEQIVRCLQDGFGLKAAELDFLPLGADMNTAVYRVVADDETPYFLKLREDVFGETSVTFPKLLSERGIKQVISPLAARTGQLWFPLTPYKMILCPFVEDLIGYEVRLSDRHWIEFGSVLRRIQGVEVPPALQSWLSEETFEREWRDHVRAFIQRIERDILDDPVVADLTMFLKRKRREIIALVERAARLENVLQVTTPEMIVCHADMHAGNVLISSSGDFYIVTEIAQWNSQLLWDEFCEKSRCSHPFVESPSKDMSVTSSIQENMS